MNRKIIFRGWNNKYKCWNYVNNPMEDCALIDQNSVGQYTGLNDSNGRYIYEGDILADLKGCIIGAVQGGVRGYCYDVVYPRPIKGETDWSLYGIVVNDYGGKVVVAGNIYENPELMKGGEK